MHIIEERSAEEKLNAALLKWSSTRVAWEAATWAVVHDPGLGAYVTESGKTRAFTFPGARSIDMPDITLLYEIRGETIVIHDALFEESAYSQDGRA